MLNHQKFSLAELMKQASACQDLPFWLFLSKSLLITFLGKSPEP